MIPEELFNSTNLDVIISEEVHDLSDMSDVDDWHVCTGGSACPRFHAHRYPCYYAQSCTGCTVHNAVMAIDEC